MAIVEPRRRRRADGTLGSVRYRVRWRDPDGQERSETFDRAAAARAKAAEVEADKNRGTYIDPRAGRVLFCTYADDWHAAQTVDPSTHDAMGSLLRRHINPTLGDRQIRAIRPSDIQAWLKTIDHLSPRYRRRILSMVSSILAAAVDDDIIAKNPCSARSVTKPRVPPRQVKPWPLAWLSGVHDSLPGRYRIIVMLAAGLGLRQGEAFALSPDDIDLEAGEVHVRRQVKLIRGRQVFALPKYQKTRTIPLPGKVWEEIAVHLDAWPARPVTLPWKGLDGPPVTAPLILTSRESKAPHRGGFNANVWKPALRAAGIPATRENGCHALRHLYASVLLDAGESIKAVSEYLGHSDPGFTLRTYTHLMPTSAERSRRAINMLVGSARGPDVAHGPQISASEQVKRPTAQMS